jgi:hypothetical protein
MARIRVLAPGFQCFLSAHHRVLESNICALENPIGTQDSNKVFEDWHTGFQECGNEHNIFIELHTGFKIGILCVARLEKLTKGFIKQNGNFKNSQD